MPGQSRRNDDGDLRRTQRSIAVVRIAFAVAASAVIGIVLLTGDHNDDQYTVPDAEWDVRLWQLLVPALLVLGIVFIGAVSDFVRAAKRRRVL